MYVHRPPGKENCKESDITSRRIPGCELACYFCSDVVAPTDVRMLVHASNHNSCIASVSYRGTTKIFHDHLGFN